MVLAGEALAVLDLHHLPSPWMERIEDQNLDRRTPGIVTLSRPVPASPTLPSQSPDAAFDPAHAVGSTMSSTSSTASKQKPVPGARVGSPIT